MAASALIIAAGSSAFAGGLDRSGQGIGALFESGDYAELSYGYVMPSVSGENVAIGGSGNMAQNYSSLGFAVKTDLSDKLSAALIFDKAFGAAIDYTNADPTYAVGVPPVTAELSGEAMTALLRYKFSDRMSVHGGARIVTMSGNIDLTGAAGPELNYAASSDVGYVIGAAYEIPDIALRAAINYSSATTHNNEKSLAATGTVVGATGDYTMPQSVNLDFQTGIAANTLLLASVRWADWTETSIDTGTPLGLGVIDYDNDSYSYSLGIGRKFSDTFSGVARISYEAAQGGLASNLSPTDGSVGLTLAGVYTMDNMKVTAGVSYVKLGDATTEGTFTDFSGNSALGFGVKIGYSF
ncbi:MAG: hypothetical protein EBT13_02945 [Rhodobacteraceae bacterium]|nr:hypothetical protein [Paracoccaceae bacterium]